MVLVNMVISLAEEDLGLAGNLHIAGARTKA